jgi:hypothetical protein
MSQQILTLVSGFFFGTEIMYVVAKVWTNTHYIFKFLYLYGETSLQVQGNHQ